MLGKALVPLVPSTFGSKDVLGKAPVPLVPRWYWTAVGGGEHPIKAVAKGVPVLGGISTRGR